MAAADDIMLADWSIMLDQLDLSPLAGQRFLLTGASGLIGRYIAGPIALANRRLDLGCRLVCVSRHQPRVPFTAADGVEWRLMDLARPLPPLEPFDFVFHAACYAQPSRWFADRLSLVDLNVNATRSLLDLIRQSRGNLMFCSSVSAYGEPAAEMYPLREDCANGPDTQLRRAIYGESKRLGEALCAVYREDHGVHAHAARISHLYGPGIGLDDQRVLGDFMRQALAGGPIRLRDPGRAVKTYGYVADAAVMMFRILLHGRDQLYNVGGIDRLTIRDLADRIARLAGGVEVIVPDAVDSAPHIGSDPPLTAVDLGRYAAEFGMPAFTDLDTGLARMIGWAAAEAGLGAAVR